MLTFLAALSALAATSTEAPITAVTVFSDRARVTRTATLHLGGPQRVELPLLPDSVDPGSIRVEATGGEVRRVDIAHVQAEEFPQGQARAILEQLEKLDDKIGAAQSDRNTCVVLLGAIGRLSPSVPTGDPLKAPPKLSPSGWSGVFAFADAWSDKLRARIRDFDDKLRDLRKERGKLAADARNLGGARRRSGYRVTPVVAGTGTARVSVVYMIGGARWYPTYDIQLQPDKGQVQINFAGQVSQETGEDWIDASLTLSTAIPATSTTVPELYTWKIGEKERFIPRPPPYMEAPKPPPPSVPPPPPAREDEALRSRLLSRAGASPGDGAVATGETAQAQPEAKEDRDADGIPDAMDDEDKDYRGLEGKKMAEKRPYAQPAEAPPPPPAAPPVGRSYSSTIQSAPGVMREEAETVTTAERSRSKWSFSSADSAPSEPPPVMAEVGIAPPPGYRRPSYSSDLPVSLAGGYDLAFAGLRPETVRTGKGARRVALRTETWPVSVERKVFPALAQDAFLVAELKNPSPTPLPGGNANLFVGADPAGVARLKLVAPGEPFTLPLGLDRAIEPKRNVSLVTTEKGLISKDEINEYVVTTEIANPYRIALPLRVIDQYPLSGNKDTEIKLLRTEPAPSAHEPLRGELVWRLSVPPGGKATVKFIYSIKRPKGWRLH